MYRIVLVLAVAAWGSTEGSEWASGTCPKWQDLPRYIPEGGLFYKYLYLQRSQNNYLFREEGSCASSYNSVEHGIIMSLYQQKRENETDMGIGYADVEHDKDFPTTRIFNLKFVGNDQQVEINLPVMMVATDQENYGVLYSCQSLSDKSLDEDTNPKKMETVLVYTAKRGDTSFDDKIKSELAAIGLDYDSFKVIDQSNC